MLCSQMRMKALETPPADQTFNRVTAEVARNVAARLKSRWRLRSHQRQGIILASNEQLFCEVGLRGRSELVLCRQKVLNEKAITRDPICGPELAQCLPAAEMGIDGLRTGCAAVDPGPHQFAHVACPFNYCRKRDI
jgi:hypothetical protein